MRSLPTLALKREARELKYALDGYLHDTALKDWGSCMSEAKCQHPHHDRVKDMKMKKFK